MTWIGKLVPSYFVLQALTSDTESDPESVPGVHNKKVTEAEIDTVCEDCLVANTARLRD